jgi:hypothetical protein
LFVNDPLLPPPQDVLTALMSSTAVAGIDEIHRSRGVNKTRRKRARRGRNPAEEILKTARPCEAMSW